MQRKCIKHFLSSCSPKGNLTTSHGIRKGGFLFRFDCRAVMRHGMRIRPNSLTVRTLKREKEIVMVRRNIKQIKVRLAFLYRTVFGCLVFTPFFAYADNTSTNIVGVAFDEEILLGKAKLGDVHAQAMLGLMNFEKSDGKSRQKGREWFEKAVKGGLLKKVNTNDMAMLYCIGVIHGNGCGVPTNDVEAVRLYRKAAESGYTRGMYKLGLRYMDGHGVDKDEKEGVKWLLKAAAKGDADAQFEVAYAYFDGIGVERDIKRFLDWMRKAADNGNLLSQMAMGIFYAEGLFGTEKTNYGRELLENAVKRGALDLLDENNPGAACRLGDIYDNGYGVATNDIEAVRLYRKAAEAGYAEGEYKLGEMYFRGEGVEKDYAEGARWILKAAEKGVAEAQYRIAIAYLNGKGVEKDKKKSMEWLHKAATNNYDRAQFDLGLMYESGDDVDLDYNEAVKWYNLAADNGNASAQNNLGVLYYYGRGVEKNYVKAAQWFVRAADNGDLYAKYNLAYNYRDGIGVRQDLNKALTLFEEAYALGKSDAGKPLEELKGKMAAFKQLLEKAKTGDVDAQMKVAKCYEDGDGIECDFSEAARWYKMTIDALSKREWYEGPIFITMGWMFLFSLLIDGIKALVNAIRRKTCRNKAPIMGDDSSHTCSDLDEEVFESTGKEIDVIDDDFEIEGNLVERTNAKEDIR